MSEKPAGENGFLTEHAGLLIASFRYWTGNELVPDNGTALTKARALWEAPFAVVSHNTDQDPIFNYGNATALRLFEMDWSSLTQLPLPHVRRTGRTGGEIAIDGRSNEKRLCRRLLRHSHLGIRAAFSH